MRHVFHRIEGVRAHGSNAIADLVRSGRDGIERCTGKKNDEQGLPGVAPAWQPGMDIGQHPDKNRATTDG